MTEIMEKARSMIKNMDKGIRMMKSAAARLRRKQRKKVIQERTENLYARLRRVRKSK